MGFHPTSTGFFYVSRQQPELALISFKGWGFGTTMNFHKSLSRQDTEKRRKKKAPKLKCLTFILQGNYMANSSFWSLCGLLKADVFPNRSSFFSAAPVCLGGFAALVTMVMFCSQMFTHPFCIIPFASPAVATQPLWVLISAAFKLFPRHLHALAMNCTLALSKCSCRGRVQLLCCACPSSHTRPSKCWV